MVEHFLKNSRPSHLCNVLCKLVCYLSIDKGNIYTNRYLWHLSILHFSSFTNPLILFILSWSEQCVRCNTIGCSRSTIPIYHLAALATRLPNLWGLHAAFHPELYATNLFAASQWRQNERDWVSNHQPKIVCSNRGSKKTSNLRVTGPCDGDRWIPRTKCQSRGKCFRLMTSLCVSNAAQSYIATDHNDIEMIVYFKWPVCRFQTCIFIVH